MKVNCSTCRETWGASSGQPPRALRVVAAMRGSFRPPGGRFDMQPPSRGVDITTLADWSESVDAGPKVGVGVSAARAMRLGGAGKRFVAARETRAVKALLAAQADARHGVPVVQTSAPPSPAKSPPRSPGRARAGASGLSADISRALSPATHFSDDDVSSVAPPKSPPRRGGDGGGDGGGGGGGDRGGDDDRVCGPRRFRRFFC